MRMKRPGAVECPAEGGARELLLVDYCAGRLAPAMARELEAHIFVCTDCRSAMEAQEAVWSALDSWDAPAITPDFNRRLFAAIDREESRHSTLVKWMRGLAGSMDTVSLASRAAAGRGLCHAAGGRHD